ncbi:GDSL-type esterase/lipase family protein [uncultured Schumannella sp.]|uniref:GDSL-type esterase/lipase family protein n=1 Tax=uncultured Schumannella sp. TaxID=1195956 RepID=UPI0025E26058|nr:GDSL-type esterase/lipase family protein [uncultured Schumannella sp.]
MLPTPHATRPIRSAAIRTLLALVRPILRAHLAQYRRDVLTAPFPSDEPVTVVEGPSPRRMLFVGDVGAAGYGVLRHGMAVPARAAAAIAASRSRGVEIQVIASPDLTAAGLSAAADHDLADLDVAVLMLGIPDVLLATTAESWSADLARAIAELRDEAGQACHVIIAGIPPVSDFRPVPAPARAILDRQTAALNRASERLAGDCQAVSFVPFPDLRLGTALVEDSISWPSLHRIWAEAIANATIAALARMDRSAR